MLLACLAAIILSKLFCVSEMRSILHPASHAKSLASSANFFMWLPYGLATLSEFTQKVPTTQEVDHILGPFWFFTQQRVPRI